MATPLALHEIDEALKTLPGWEIEHDHLVRRFTFSDFRQAFVFMTSIAFIAEEMNHHPTLENTYHRVKVSLSTHDAGNKVTQKDVALAMRIQAL
jgi:4a-hydroxytetrahydrobiopterin dehydratase